MSTKLKTAASKLAKFNHGVVHFFEHYAHVAFFVPFTLEHSWLGHLAMGATSFSLILAVAEMVAEHSTEV